MNIANINSPNAITAPQVIGSYTDKRFAEAARKIEDYHRAHATAIRRKHGIMHDNPLRCQNERRSVHAYIKRLTGGQATMNGIVHDNPVNQLYYLTLLDMVREGKVSTVGSDHPALTGQRINIPSAVSAENFKFAGDVMSGQFKSLFSRNGIHIPANLKLLFIVDPASFKVRVSGTDDTSLIARLEEILNYGGNGGQLAQFIFESNAMPMTQEQRQQFLLMQRVKFITGLDMRDMSIINNRFVTADGRDLTAVFEEAARASDGEHDRAVAETGFIMRELERLAPIWDTIPPPNFEIGWQNGGLLTAQGQRIGFNIMA